MAENRTVVAPIPPLLIWCIIGFVVGIGIIWGYAGTRHTLWWLGLLVGPLFISWAFAGLYGFFFDRKRDNLALAAEIVSKLSLLFSGLVLLFGALIVVKVVTSPFFGPSYSEEPQNYRR
jgi:4-hydroxybenzoate polyprenyltransferase